MSSSTSATSGAKSDTSGSDDQTKTKSETYSADFVEKLKKEKENYSKSLSALKEELAGIKRQQEEATEKELVAQAKYKEAFEAEKKRAEKLSEDLKAKDQKITQGSINSSLRTELLKLGAEETHLDTIFKLIDRSTVSVDPETSVVIGADMTAKTFYEKHSGLGFFKKSGAKPNHEAARGGNPNAQPDLKKLSYEEKLKLLKAK